MDISENTDLVERSVIDFIDCDKEKKTPGKIFAFLRENFGLKRKNQQKIINNLISEKKLEYTYEFGNSFLELSFSQPVSVSNHFILTPPEIYPKQRKDRVIIKIEKGVSFGRGAHPTTRLMLRCIDDVLYEKKGTLPEASAADIGTGNGVLAIAGALIGIKKVFACDIDTVSLHEARRNANLNQVGEKIIFDTIVNNKEKHDYIFANLRYPTLIDMKKVISGITKNKAIIFFSGIQTEEKKLIYKNFPGKIFKPVIEKEEKGWVAIVFEKQTAFQSRD